eukprot:SAG31_NODE_6274_length_2093_cov_2.302407_4_plen_62_part_00
MVCAFIECSCIYRTAAFTAAFTALATQTTLLHSRTAANMLTLRQLIVRQPLENMATRNKLQ